MKVLEARTGDLQRQLLIAQSDLKAVKEDAQLQDVAKAQLEAQVAGDCPLQLYLLVASLNQAFCCGVLPGAVASVPSHQCYGLRNVAVLALLLVQQCCWTGMLITYDARHS